MRWTLARITCLLIVIASLGFPALARTQPEQSAFTESFDDPALPGWERSANITVDSGVLRMDAGGFAFRPGLWDDATLTVRTRLTGQGVVEVGYRVRDTQQYVVSFSGGDLALSRIVNDRAVELRRVPVAVSPGAWVEISATVIGGSHTISLDGQAVITVKDDKPLEPGGVMLRVEGEAVGEFDEVMLSVAGGAPGTVDAGAKYPVEPVVVYTDDMRNGMFDAMVESSGGGRYAVEDDGAGNLAAHLSGSTRLRMRAATWVSRTWESYDLVARVRMLDAGSASLGFRWIAPHPNAPGLPARGYWLNVEGERWSIDREVDGAVTRLVETIHPAQVGEWQTVRIEVRATPAGAEMAIYLDGELLLEHIDPDPIPYGGMAFRTEGDGAELWLDDVEVILHVDSRYTWSQTGGPLGADDINAITVDPRDWRVVYVAGMDSGVFKTTDAGETWTEIAQSREMWTNRIRAIELAPSDPSIVYLGAGTKHVSPLGRSDDGGETWRWTDVEADLERLDGADVLGLAIDPDDPMHVYFGVASGLNQVPRDAVGVYESTDGGETITQVFSGGGEIGPVVLDPSNSRHILAGSLRPEEAGFSVIGSTDGGETWAPSDNGMDGVAITQILFHPSEPDYVFAVESFAEAPERGGRIYRSADGGATWTQLPSLATANTLQFAALDTPTLLAFGPEGLLASTDAGGSWEFISMACAIVPGAPVGLGTDDPEVLYQSTAPSISVSTDLGRTCTQTSLDGFLAQPVAGMAASPTDPEVAYAATISGIYRTDDYGASWGYIHEGGFAGLAVDPNDSDTVYIGASEFAIVRKSTDGGETWRDITGPIDFGVATLVIDPNDSDTIYAGTGMGPQLPPGGTGLYKSTDAGETWEKVPGIPDVAVPAIAIHHSDSNIVAVGTMGAGIFVSYDGGQTFEARNDGMADDAASRYIWALVMDPRDANVMYAGTNTHYASLGDVANPVNINFNGVYKTIDGGERWEVMLGNDETSKPPYNFIGLGGGTDAIAINPVRPDEVYVALHDPGIVFTENGGTDWRYVNVGLAPLLTHVYPYRMTISADGEVLYATTCGRSVYRNLVMQPEDQVTALAD